LQIARDLGVVGVLLVLWVLATFWRRGRRAMRSIDAPWGRVWGLAAICTLVVIGPRLAWDFVFTGSPGVLLLMIGAMSVNTARARRRPHGQALSNPTPGLFPSPLANPS